MKKEQLFIAVSGLFLLAHPVPAAAAEQQIEAAMKKMRDSLRNTMIQLQTAQAEKATAEAKLAESEEQNKKLGEDIEKLKKELASVRSKADEDKKAADKAIAELDGKIANRDQELASLTESLEKWKKGYADVVALAKKTEGARQQAVSKSVVLERKVAERERQNAELYQTGAEILKRYENFGLGKALLSREPFVGTMRVKLETQVQDYRDKLQDQKVKPEAGRKAGTDSAGPERKDAGGQHADSKGKS